MPSHSRPTGRTRLVLAFLALATLVVLSGCSAVGSLSLDPVESDADVGTEATHDLSQVAPSDAEGNETRDALARLADEAFGRLVERFRAVEGVLEDDYYGEWLVRWDGETYYAKLRYDGFVN